MQFLNYLVSTWIYFYDEDIIYYLTQFAVHSLQFFPVNTKNPFGKYFFSDLEA